MRCETESRSDESYYRGAMVTLSYNQARLMESVSDSLGAEQEYKKVLNKHPHYIDCELGHLVAAPLLAAILLLFVLLIKLIFIIS